MKLGSMEIRLLLCKTSSRSLARARNIALLTEFASFWNDMQLSTGAVQKFCSTRIDKSHLAKSRLRVNRN